MTIRPARTHDLPMLTAWRSQAHVVRWWGRADVEPERLDDPRISTWIGEFRSRPFAFIQDYNVGDWSPHHFDFLPAGSRGLDMYIGEADLLGVGCGSALLRQHAEALLDGQAPALGIDPHPNNRRAVRAFCKAGFAVAGGPLDTSWGRAILMTRYAKAACANGSNLPPSR